MNVIEHTYACLLADVARLTGFSELTRGSWWNLQWLLHEAPQLEKQVLRAIEAHGKRHPLFEKNREIADYMDWMDFPRPLQRLALGFEKNPILLRYLRQLLLFSYKAEVTHDKQTTEQAFQKFFETNYTVGRFGAGFNNSSPYLLDLARRHVQSVLYRTNWRDIQPSPGPGSVTTSKDEFGTCFSTIEAIYPYSDYFQPYFREEAARWEDLEHADHIQAKLIAVPKDSRGPRLICVHPAEAIWIQQGLRRKLERAISRVRRSNGPWPRNHVNFESQWINGRIASLSSVSRQYATIDMKEASDRISDVLVQILFGSHYKYFGSCRAQTVIAPGHGLSTVRAQLHCYAPMGNATTFPVQSLVFWAICVASLQRHGFHQPGAVFVFGDDIIVPTELAQYVIDDLESFGLVVNRDKTFVHGDFRESCGVDAYKGVDVTPQRWKTTMKAEDLLSLQSLSQLGMRLRTSGYEAAAASVFSHVGRTMRSSFGKRLFVTNNPDHGGIAEFSERPSLAWENAYWHSQYQKFVSPIWQIQQQSSVGSFLGWYPVVESLCSLELSARSHVEAEPVSRRVRLKRGWTSIA